MPPLRIHWEQLEDEELCLSFLFLERRGPLLGFLKMSASSSVELVLSSSVEAEEDPEMFRNLSIVGRESMIVSILSDLRSNELTEGSFGIELERLLLGLICNAAVVFDAKLREGEFEWDEVGVLVFMVCVDVGS